MGSTQWPGTALPRLRHIPPVPEAQKPDLLHKGRERLAASPGSRDTGPDAAVNAVTLPRIELAFTDADKEGIPLRRAEPEQRTAGVPAVANPYQNRFLVRDIGVEVTL
jgi:hypothetical protein